MNLKQKNLVVGLLKNSAECHPTTFGTHITWKCKQNPPKMWQVEILESPKMTDEGKLPVFLQTEDVYQLISGIAFIGGFTEIMFPMPGSIFKRCYLKHTIH